MRLCVSVGLVAVLFAGLSAGYDPSQASPDILVLTNVNVVDTRHGRVEKYTVVVKEGRIAALAKVGLIQKSSKLRIVNSSGKYLIPGLWDMHVHTAGGPAPAWDENVIYPLYVANGVTGVRDMGGDPKLLESRRERIERGDVLGPRLIFAGPFLDGGKNDAQVLAVNTPAEARQAVRTLKQMGADFIKVLSRVPHDSYLAIADEAARLHMRFVGHVPESVSAAEASASGQRSIEHLSGIMLACSSEENELRQRRMNALAKDDAAGLAALNRQTLATYNAAKASKLFTEFTNHNTYQVPTLVWWQAAANVDNAALTADFRLQYVPMGVRAQWKPAQSPQPSTGQEPSDARQMFARYVELVHAMHRAGVPFMAGTDGPDPYVFPGFSLHDELELLAKAGFSNAEALAAATFYPALFMVKLDRYGVVEPGRFADMVLLDANPLDDIRNTRKISAVILRGKYYSRPDLDRMLAQVAEAAKKQDTVAGRSVSKPAAGSSSD
jgi:hypothetical protein